MYIYKKQRLINFGTSWQVDEMGNNLPFNAYASSKNSVESFFYHFALNGLRVPTLGLYDTYGPNDKRDKILKYNRWSDSKY